jgi:hypothetical protein
MLHRCAPADASAAHERRRDRAMGHASRGHATQTQGRAARCCRRRTPGAGVAIAAGFATTLLALPAVGAPAGAWSEITGERQTKSALNRAGTVVKLIDHQRVVERQPRVRPGFHVVVVQWVPRTGLTRSERTLRLDMKPCKRYYVHAQFASPGSSLWNPVIDKVEDIPGCRVPAAVDIERLAPPPPSPSPSRPAPAE